MIMCFHFTQITCKNIYTFLAEANVQSDSPLNQVFSLEQSDVPIQIHIRSLTRASQNLQEFACNSQKDNRSSDI
jgi:hypothetical protein